MVTELGALVAKGRVSIVGERCIAGGFCVEFGPTRGALRRLQFQGLASAACGASGKVQQMRFVRDEELGKRMVVNSVMVGFFSSVTKLLSTDAVRRAVANSVPSSFRELNRKAFETGCEYGLNARPLYRNSPHNQMHSN